jgi:hypothetical protein
MNLPPINHAYMLIQDKMMGILLVVLACLGRHGIAQYEGSVVRLGE